MHNTRPGNYTFKITNKETGAAIVNKSIELKVYIPGKKVAYVDKQTSKTDANGFVNYQLSKIYNQYDEPDVSLNIGTYNITITGLDDLNSTAILPITVERADLIITPNIYREDRGSTKNFTMTVTSLETGKRIVLLNYYTFHSQKTSITQLPPQKVELEK